MANLTVQSLDPLSGEMEKASGKLEALEIEERCNENVTVNGYHSPAGSEEDDEFHQKWGFGLANLYKLAMQFVKEKEGKAVHLSYKDKLSLVAFSQQISQGPYNNETSSPLGYLDVIGRDRRQAWANLGDMPAEKCRSEYIKLLDNVCPLFETFVEAHKRDVVEKERKKREEEERIRKEREEEELRVRLEKEAEEVKQQELQRQEAQRRQIQDALNQQTYHQFKAYAEQQYPGNPEQQAVLVRQLQEQHYQQYMQQVYQQQLLGQQDNSLASKDQETTAPPTPKMDAIEKEDVEGEEEEEEDASDAESASPEGPNVASASMWTRKDIDDFKEAIKKEGGDSVIKVGHGETVTVRVPTHEDGTCLFWEFATNSYDLGFGLYFEWSKSETSQVSVHVSESEEDEEDEYEDGEHDDIERGAIGRLTQPAEDKPPVTVIIPVYRRECQKEVYAGSHVYPGQGVYLLKFDNSYSLWRSKTLYYRVYYTR